MNLKRCGNGHFYDSDRYEVCPHCQSASGFSKESVTVPLKPDDVVTTPLSISASSETVTVPVSNAGKTSGSSGDDQKTISYSSQAIGTEPVVGWLVITEGPDLGCDFRLKMGRNFIGRSKTMDICLQHDNTVSREKHGVVVYDHKSCTFIVQPGESKELCYLNNEVVLVPQKLKLNDVISVGETDLMFVPFCSKDGFMWDKRNNKKE